MAAIVANHIPQTQEFAIYKNRPAAYDCVMMSGLRALLALVILASPGMCCCVLASDARPLSTAPTAPAASCCCCTEQQPAECNSLPISKKPPTPACPCKKHQVERVAVRGNEVDSTRTANTFRFDDFQATAPVTELGISPDLNHAAIGSGVAPVPSARARLHWQQRLTC